MKLRAAVLTLTPTLSRQRERGQDKGCMTPSPLGERVGVRANGASIARPACPHPSLPPEGEGAKI